MKRRVTMTNTIPLQNGTATQQAVDYVPLSMLDAYVADARTRWALVEVGPLDDGPGGSQGLTATVDEILGG